MHSAFSEGKDDGLAPKGQDPRHVALKQTDSQGRMP